MPYKRQLVRGFQWVASYYVPAEAMPEQLRGNKRSCRVYEPASEAGFPNTEAGSAQLEKRRRLEIAQGTYVYKMRGEHTAATWLSEWTAQRSTRDKAMDRRRVENHFLSFRDFASRKLSTFRPSDFKTWAKHGRELVAAGKLSAKTFINAYGVVHTMFHEAVANEKIAVNPCVLSRGDLPMRRAKRGRKYEDRESRELVWCEQLPVDIRMLFCLLHFTGERIGEACGHTWSDWDRDPQPLGALALERQYDNRPLKTSTDVERPRVVPVHPELAKALDWWRREGWAAFYGRPPSPDDPIIPNLHKRGHHSPKSVYHAARDAFELVGLPWKGHHACRHAFVTAVRRAGAPTIWVERITHNAQGSIVDHYTHTEWLPLCDVVLLLSWTVSLPVAVQEAAYSGDRIGDNMAKVSRESGAGEGIRTLRLRGNAREKSRKQASSAGLVFPDGSGVADAVATGVADGPTPAHGDFSDLTAGAFMGRSVSVDPATLRGHRPADLLAALSVDTYLRLCSASRLIVGERGGG